jgi:hypothetical protein
LACLVQRGKKNQWKSVWGGNYKINAQILITFE